MSGASGASGSSSGSNLSGNLLGASPSFIPNSLTGSEEGDVAIWNHLNDPPVYSFYSTVSPQSSKAAAALHFKYQESASSTTASSSSTSAPAGPAPWTPSNSSLPPSTLSLMQMLYQSYLNDVSQKDSNSEEKETDRGEPNIVDLISSLPLRSHANPGQLAQKIFKRIVQDHQHHHQHLNSVLTAGGGNASHSTTSGGVTGNQCISQTYDYFLKILSDLQKNSDLNFDFSKDSEKNYPFCSAPEGSSVSSSSDSKESYFSLTNMSSFLLPPPPPLKLISSFPLKSVIPLESDKNISSIFSHSPPTFTQDYTELTNNSSKLNLLKDILKNSRYSNKKIIIISNNSYETILIQELLSHLQIPLISSYPEYQHTQLSFTPQPHHPHHHPLSPQSHHPHALSPQHQHNFSQQQYLNQNFNQSFEQFQFGYLNPHVSSLSGSNSSQVPSSVGATQSSVPVPHSLLNQETNLSSMMMMMMIRMMKGCDPGSSSSSGTATGAPASQCPTTSAIKHVLEAIEHNSHAKVDGLTGSASSGTPLSQTHSLPLPLGDLDDTVGNTVSLSEVNNNCLFNSITPSQIREEWKKRQEKKNKFSTNTDFFSSSPPPLVLLTSPKSFSCQTAPITDADAIILMSFNFFYEPYDPLPALKHQIVKEIEQHYMKTQLKKKNLEKEARNDEKTGKNEEKSDDFSSTPATTSATPPLPLDGQTTPKSEENYLLSTEDGPKPLEIIKISTANTIEEAMLRGNCSLFQLQGCPLEDIGLMPKELSSLVSSSTSPPGPTSPSSLTFLRSAPSLPNTVRVVLPNLEKTEIKTPEKVETTQSNESLMTDAEVKSIIKDKVKLLVSFTSSELPPADFEEIKLTMTDLLDRVVSKHDATHSPKTPKKISEEPLEKVVKKKQGKGKGLLFVGEKGKTVFIPPTASAPVSSSMDVSLSPSASAAAMIQSNSSIVNAYNLSRSGINYALTAIHGDHRKLAATNAHSDGGLDVFLSHDSAENSNTLPVTCPGGSDSADFTEGSGEAILTNVDFIFNPATTIISSSLSVANLSPSGSCSSLSSLTSSLPPSLGSTTSSQRVLTKSAEFFLTSLLKKQQNVLLEFLSFPDFSYHSEIIETAGFSSCIYYHTYLNWLILSSKNSKFYQNFTNSSPVPTSTSSGSASSSLLLPALDFSLTSGSPSLHVLNKNPLNKKKKKKDTTVSSFSPLYYQFPPNNSSFLSYFSPQHLLHHYLNPPGIPSSLLSLSSTYSFPSLSSSCSPYFMPSASSPYYYALPSPLPPLPSSSTSKNSSLTSPFSQWRKEDHTYLSLLYHHREIMNNINKIIHHHLYDKLYHLFQGYDVQSLSYPGSTSKLACPLSLLLRYVDKTRTFIYDKFYALTLEILFPGYSKSFTSVSLTPASASSSSIQRAYHESSFGNALSDLIVRPVVVDLAYRPSEYESSNEDQEEEKVDREHIATGSSSTKNFTTLVQTNQSLSAAAVASASANSSGTGSGGSSSSSTAPTTSYPTLIQAQNNFNNIFGLPQSMNLSAFSLFSFALMPYLLHHPYESAASLEKPSLQNYFEVEQQELYDLQYQLYFQQNINMLARPTPLVHIFNKTEPSLVNFHYKGQEKIEEEKIEKNDSSPGEETVGSSASTSPPLPPFPPLSSLTPSLPITSRTETIRVSPLLHLPTPPRLSRGAVVYPEPLNSHTNIANPSGLLPPSFPKHGGGIIPQGTDQPASTASASCSRSSLMSLSLQPLGATTTSFYSSLSGGTSTSSYKSQLSQHHPPPQHHPLPYSNHPFSFFSGYQGSYDGYQSASLCTSTSLANATDSLVRIRYMMKGITTKGPTRKKNTTSSTLATSSHSSQPRDEFSSHLGEEGEEEDGVLKVKRSSGDDSLKPLKFVKSTKNSSVASLSISTDGSGVLPGAPGSASTPLAAPKKKKYEPKIKLRLPTEASLAVSPNDEY